MKNEITIDTGDECLESFPCQHYVSINDGEKELMGGVEIFELYEKYDLEVPGHFKEYNPKTFKI
jgi:hypothetical protein